MRKLYALIIIWMVALLPQRLMAQKLEANGPSQVSAGEPFRVTYTVNTQDASGFKAGAFPDALEVLAGPYTSRQSSYQMINGHTSSSSSITYTYTVCANKNGSFTIPAAHITAGGKSIASNTLHITVSGTARQSGGHSQQQNAQPQMRAAGSKISANDLFIRVSANKQRIHEQEPVLLTYKVYTLVDLTSLNGKMPDLKGFHTQEVQLPQQKSFKVETYNGRPYRTVTWSQYVMFPQVTGKLTIPSITFEGTVIQQNRDVDPFEAFFNGGSGYVEVKKSIKAPGLTIQVDPLPTRPTNFSGGVGRMNISAQLNKTTVKANDPVTMRVVVSGVGNLKLIKEPQAQFPKDFDKYDAKVTDKTKLTSNGVEGNMVYDIMFVPRHQGNYEIPPIEFTYYDTGANAYKTVRTQKFDLTVEKGAGGSGAVTDYSGQSEVEQLNKDIRYIKLGDAKLRSVGDFFYNSTGYWVAVAVMLLVFVTLAVVFRRRAIENANIGKMRAGKANKVATKRLRKAKKLMDGGNASAFYDETLRALWGYVGDKLNMPAEKLTRENIRERLAERGVEELTVQSFITALDECEFERYAPGDSAGNMAKTFEAAMTAIMQIENVMKHKKTASAKTVVVVGLLLAALASLPGSAGAVTKANADSAYARQQYQQAVKDYEEMLTKGVSPEIYFNLGNAYYRSGNITRAIINYERASLLSPGDADVRYNLQLARSKTIDKITPESEMFFFEWWRALVNIQSVDGWAWTSLWSLAVAVVLLLVYLFAAHVWMRKVGFFGSIGLALLFIVSNVFAYQQRQLLENRTGAIVTVSSVAVKSTPAHGGTDLFVIHEGTKVNITDGSMNDWKKVRLADGRDGWVETKAMEII